MWYRQEHQNTCVIAALRSVLSEQFGVAIAEVALEALGTEASYSIREHGANFTDMRRILNGANHAFNTGKPWHMTCRRHGGIPDLRRWLAKGCYPMVQVVNDEYHLVVVRSIGRYWVNYFDPYDGKHHSCRIGPFRRWWRNAEGLTWFSVVFL